MKKSPEGLTTNIASSRNWFRSKLLPDGIQLRRQRLEGAAEIQCYDGIKLLFIDEGCGTLIVNGKNYPLRAGSCCLLYCFHFHKIVPSPNEFLRISTCHISYNTFLFATIVPGYHLSEIEQSQTPILVNFTQPQHIRIKQILSTMEQAESEAGDAMQYALLYEWLGRICRTFAKQSSASGIGPQCNYE